jgi:YVTN family beta-propeller protein
MDFFMFFDYFDGRFSLEREGYCQMKSAITSLMCVLVVAAPCGAAIQDVKHAVTIDGSIDPQILPQARAIRFSEIPEELNRLGYGNISAIWDGHRAPEIDEFPCGIPPETDVPMFAAITPDGSRAVHSFFLSGNIGIQNLSTFAWDHVVTVGDGAFAVAITPTGSHALVSCVNENTVVAVNLSTYSVEHTISVGQAPINVAIAPDGSRAVVLNSDDDSVSVIDLDTWTVERTVSGISNGVYLTWNTIGRFAYEPTEVCVLNDNLTAVVPAGDTVEFIDMTSGSVTTLTLVTGIAKDMDITRDGTMMAVAGYNDQEVTFIDLTQSPPVISGGFSIAGYWYNSDTIKFTADGSLLALGQVPDAGGYTYLTFYDTSTYQPVPGFSENNGGITGMALSADGTAFLSVGYYAVYVDLTTGLPVIIASEPADNMFYFAESPTDTIAVCGMTLSHEMTAVYDYSVTIHSRLDFSRPGINPEGDGPKHIVMIPDGTIAISADLISDTVSFIDTNAGTVLDCIDVGDQPYFISISHDGLTALSCDFESSQVSVIDVVNRTVLVQLQSKRRPANCVFSSDGTRAYAVSVGASPNDYLSVYDIDGASSTHVTDIDLGLNMYGFYIMGGWTPNPAITADGGTIVVPGANPSNKCAIIINTETLTVETHVDLSTTPEMPFYAAVNPAGNRAIIVDGQGDTIHFIELNSASSTLLHSMSPGNYPFQAVYSSDGAYAYINNWDDSSIVVIDTATYGIVQTVNMPGSPTHMTPSNGTLYVACEVNDPIKPTINSVSMDGDASELQISIEKDYYSYFVAACNSPEVAITNCTGWDTYSWMHDVEPGPTNTPGPPTETPLPTETSPPTSTSPPTDTPPPPTDTPVNPTATPVPPTDTPAPTNTSIPTFTSPPPTDTPVPPTDTPVVPTDTPVPPTNTPAECTTTGVTIFMPSDYYQPGDSCYCDASVCNAEGSSLNGYPLFVILDVYGFYNFAPSFSDYDYFDQSFPTGETIVNVLPAFTWPQNAGTASGINWYSAMTNPGITDLFGELGMFTFGWGS